jgi:hypothetical protein
MSSSHIEIESTNPNQRSAASRPQGIDQLPVMTQEGSCPTIKQYIDFLEQALTDQGDMADIDLLQEKLLELSGLLCSGKEQMHEDGYLRMLDRLTAIYAKGLRVENDNAFTSTAAHFADILKSVSQNFQNYDYSHSVSLLLHYMDRLFNAGEESWLEVYEHLLCMPDSIHVMQQLRVEHLNEINSWIEEGVDNLFSLRDEQEELIAVQAQTLRDLETQVLARHAQLQRATLATEPGVVDLNLVRQQQELRALGRRREQLMSERQTKMAIVDLLESNIREFSDRLAKIRRSTLLRLAWSNPDHY